MKKILCILLALAMLLALAACGGSGGEKLQEAADKTKEAAGKVQEAAGEAAGDLKENAQDALDKAKEAAQDAADKTKETAGKLKDAAEQKKDAAQDAAQQAVENAADAAESAVAGAAEKLEDAIGGDKELSAEEMIGDKSENSYVNTALGIRANMPANWYILSNEEIAETMGYTMDLMSDEGLAEELENSGAVCDFYAADANGSGDTLNLMLQKLEGVQGIILSEQAIAEASLEPMKEALESMGMTDVQASLGTVVFAGKEHPCIQVSSSYSGVMIYERAVLIKAGGYVGSITSGSVDEARAESILGFFEAA